MNDLLGARIGAAPVGVVAASRGRMVVFRKESVSQLGGSVFLGTGPVEVQYLRRSLLISDGDIELAPGSTIRQAVVIATGSVVGPATNIVNVDGARVYAGGAVDIPGFAEEAPCTFAAGKTVRVGDGVRAGSSVAEGATTLPYGIHFTAPADFGFRVEPKPDGMAVTALEAWSPLARYGVRAGDLLTRIGFQNVRSADALRRALRRGVMEESMVLHVARGGDRLTRVVYLDGIPERR